MTMLRDGFAISVVRTGTTLRLIVSGELDLATGPRLREHAAGRLADRAELVVLDRSNVRFIDSSGLHVLLDAAEQDPARLRIVPSPVCLRLFHIAGVRDLLPLI